MARSGPFKSSTLVVVEVENQGCFYCSTNDTAVGFVATNDERLRRVDVIPVQRNTDKKII